jgi:hypothetical protein
LAKVLRVAWVVYWLVALAVVPRVPVGSHVVSTDRAIFVPKKTVRHERTLHKRARGENMVV